MIFNVPGHIEKIIAGTKTQTRRVNRGIYQVGKDYAIQRKRGEKAISGYRIKIIDIWIESKLHNSLPISLKDAKQEGDYTPESYEFTFKKINPSWKGCSRYAFEFEVVKI